MWWPLPPARFAAGILICYRGLFWLELHVTTEMAVGARSLGCASAGFCQSREDVWGEAGRRKEARRVLSLRPVWGWDTQSFHFLSVHLFTQAACPSQQFLTQIHPGGSGPGLPSTHSLYASHLSFVGKRNRYIPPPHALSHLRSSHDLLRSPCRWETLS